MGVFMGLFKKKIKKQELPLPPAPADNSSLKTDFGDFNEIHSKNFEQQELPPLPEFPPFNLKKDKEAFEKEEPMLALPSANQLKTKFELPVAREKEAFEKIKPVSRNFLPKSFIAADDYNKILSSSNIICEKLLIADNHLKKLDELETEEDKLLSKWCDYLESIEKKMAFIDKAVVLAGDKK